MGPKRTKSQSVIAKSNRKVKELSAKKSHNNVQKDNFKFISQDYSKYLKCPLCKELMIRPMRFHPCGHTFCLNCIEHLIDVSKKFCPLQTCLSKCLKIQNDRTAQSLIDELKVACTNIGCQWKGQYDNYKKTHKDSCPLKGMGLDKYLQELRRIPIRARSNIDMQLQQSQKLDQNQHMIQSQHLLRDSYRQENPLQVEEIKQQHSYQINEVQQKKQIGNQIKTQSQQNNDQKQKQQQQNKQIKGDENHYFVDNNLKLNNRTNKDQAFKAQQKEKIKNGQNPQHFQHIQLEENHSRRINNNSIILNLPFGPSFSAQIQIEQTKRQKYITKQLKKLQ